ncbi:unnamed protein product, partial [Symbiodinium necroappetens]
VADDASETESAREGSAFPDSEGIGYTEEEFAKLDPEDQLALQAAGDDQEASMSAAFTKLVNALIAEERYEVALQACDEYLPVDSDLTDQVLHLYLKSSHQQPPSGSHDSAVHRELLDHECMYRVKGHTLAAQLTLDRYKRWDVDTAVQTLSMCLHRIETEPSADSNEAGRAAALKQELRRILQRMVSFEKILQVSDGRWQVWQEIEDMSKMQVGEAVEHLLSLQQHDMARTLAQMYGMTDPLHSLELSRLHYLFTTKHDKTNAVNRLLSLPPSQAVSFALQLLDMFDVIQHRALLCQMLLKQLQSWLTPGEEERLRVLLASLQLLGEVSETMRPHFLKLLRKPELIVESLLMNARVDLLKKFLEDFPEYRHDELILRYARKALALQSSQTPVLTEDAVEEDENDAETRLEAAASPGHRAHQAEDEGLGGPWCLTGSSRKDLEIRRRHHFEEAPNSGLTERILELCSDSPDNAAACFHICDELSFRLYDLTPKSGPGKTLATATPWQPGTPLTSVRLLTFLIRRLLSYLQGKFAGAGAEVQLKLERSLKNLDFIPRLWHVSGRKASREKPCCIDMSVCFLCYAPTMYSAQDRRLLCSQAMADIDWDGDYFDLPKDKFNAMTAGQRLDHFAKRIVKHGMERPSLVYRFHITMLLANYGGYFILIALMPRPSDLPTYDYSVLLFAKLLVWQHLAEAFGCRQGPLSGMTFPNNWMYRLSKGTLKYSCLPQLGGTKRNVVDNVVHWLFFITGWGFLLCPWYSFYCIRALFFCDVYLFVFDRTQFYAGTAHAYGSMIFAACFPLDTGSFAGMQLGLIMQWFFSGIGKIGPWFQYVNGPFMLQSRWLRGSKWLRTLLIESEDKMTPTWFGTCLAHFAAFVEYFAPIALMVPSTAAIWLGLIGLTAMHVYILLTPAPFDVYSWNLCFCLSGIYLFYIGNFGFDWASWTTMNVGLRLWFLAEFCLCWYGQFFPDDVGYYLSHRYWAGNWVQTHFMVRKTQTVKEKLDKVDPPLAVHCYLKPFWMSAVPPQPMSFAYVDRCRQCIESRGGILTMQSMSRCVRSIIFMSMCFSL